VVRLASEKSPFPADFLGVDLSYSGLWNPVGTDLDQSGVSVHHGASSEGGRADATSLSFRVKNGDGKYSPRNPSSPLYGKIGRNTPARATVALGAPWLDIKNSSSSVATLPDTAVLDITGDIDIRWHGYMPSWEWAVDLMSKWDTTGNQRSWILRAEADGTLAFFWSVNGVAVNEARSVAIPAWAGKIALRVTMDVNDGAGGRGIRFYYAPDLASDWVPLGAPVLQSGTTAIYSSTAHVRLGKAPTSSAAWAAARVYGWELRNGIGGTLATSADTATVTTVGPAQFLDVQGRNWAMTGGAAITNRHTIGVGEVAEWPMDWGRKGAPTVYTDVEAAGVTRRLGQGQRALESPFYNAVMARPATELLAYWPMEDGSSATSFGPAVGGAPATWSGVPALASYEGFPGSRPLPKIGTSTIRARVRQPSSWTVSFVQVRNLLAVPAPGIGGARVLQEMRFGAKTPSGIGKAELWVDAAGALRIVAYDWEGAVHNDTGYVSFGVNGDLARLSVDLTQSGLNVTARIMYLNAATGGSTYTFPTWTGRSLWPLKEVVVNPTGSLAFQEVGYGHLTVERSESSIYDISPSIMKGYAGESAEWRLRRLALEKGIPVAITGTSGETADMGIQEIDEWLTVARSVEAGDGGILHDDPTSLGFRYRTLHSLGSQPPVVIDYEDNKVVPFKPVDDDSMIRNRVTITRPNGSPFTASRDTGPLSVQDIPNGVGLYEDSRELNLGSDATAGATADWDVHVGTWDEGRYPTMGVDLADPRILSDPMLVRELLSLNIGDRLVINDPPPWLPPFAVDVLVMGVQYEITPLHARLTWTCIPARPYRMGYFNAGHRYSGEGTTLTAGVTSTATTLNLTLPAGVTWTHADGDYDIIVGGELMTVTNVTGGNVMTVARSINGVVKAHLAGAPVALAEPSFYAR
jgi:hypothetical protein